MNPVIGLDIAKGESQVKAVLDKGQPYGKGFTIHHTREGFEAIHSFLKHIEKKADHVYRPLPSPGYSFP